MLSNLGWQSQGENNCKVSSNILVKSYFGRLLFSAQWQNLIWCSVSGWLGSKWVQKQMLSKLIRVLLILRSPWGQISSLQKPGTQLLRQKWMLVALYWLFGISDVRLNEWIHEMINCIFDIRKRTQEKCKQRRDVGWSGERQQESTAKSDVLQDWCRGPTCWRNATALMRRRWYVVNSR